MQLRGNHMYRFGAQRLWQSGFTLFELMLVIVIMSGITMVVAFSAQRAIDKVNYETTKAKMVNIETALNKFMSLTNRLPCPANPDPSIGKTHPDYGKESCGWADDSANKISPDASVPRSRVMTTNLAAADNMIMIGRLPSYVQTSPGGPWISLSKYVPALDRLGGSLILDQTGELPRYAVTRRLAMVNASGDYGNITLQDEIGENVAGTANDVRYVVILQSYRNGGCRGAGTDRDFENCDNDSIFKIAPRALGSGAEYFDDVVLFNNKIYDNKWLAAEIDAGAGNKGAVYIDSSVRNIGVQEAAPTAKLDIGSTLRADVNVRAPLVCDQPTNSKTFTGSTNTTLEYDTGIYNDVENVVVKKTPDGGVTTTLSAGTDYTVGAYDTTNSRGIITLTNPPLVTDTITVEAAMCFDPLSVVKSFTPAFNSVNSDSRSVDTLACPKFNFSSTSIRRDNNWWKNPSGYYNSTDNTSYYNYTKYLNDTSLIDIENASSSLDGVVVNGLITIGTKKYRRINFKQPYIYYPYSSYYMGSEGGANYEDREFYLGEDPEPMNQSHAFNSVMVNYFDTISGNTIWFEAPNLIKSTSSNIFREVYAGDLITVTGSVSNNGDYIVVASNNGTTGVLTVQQMTIQNESSGSLISIERRMRQENRKNLKIYKSLCAHRNDLNPGSCVDQFCTWDSQWTLTVPASSIDGTNKEFSTNPNLFKHPTSVFVFITPPGGVERRAVYGVDYTVSGGNGGNGNNPAAIGTVKMMIAPAVGSILKIQRTQCNGATGVILVEEPVGGMIPQKNLRYAVYGERYLAGTMLDAKGAIQPICEDLRINAPSSGASQNCPAGKTVRYVKTDGSVKCND